MRCIRHTLAFFGLSADPVGYPRGDETVSEADSSHHQIDRQIPAARYTDRGVVRNAYKLRKAAALSLTDAWSSQSRFLT